ADVIFRLGVIRFQVRIRNRPVGKPGPWNFAPQRAFVEIQFEKAPVIRVEMDSAAAHLPAVARAESAARGFRRRFAKRLRLSASIVHQKPVASKLHLVMREVFPTEKRPWLPPPPGKAGLGDFLGDAAPWGAGPDAQEVPRTRCFDPGRHFSCPRRSPCRRTSRTAACTYAP